MACLRVLPCSCFPVRVPHGRRLSALRALVPQYYSGAPVYSNPVPAEQVQCSLGMVPLTLRTVLPLADSSLTVFFLLAFTANVLICASVRVRAPLGRRFLSSPCALDFRSIIQPKSRQRQCTPQGPHPRVAWLLCSSQCTCPRSSCSSQCTCPRSR